MHEIGYAADEDSIRSDINYELILLAAKVDPYKRLDGLFKLALKQAESRVYRNIIKTAQFGVLHDDIPNELNHRLVEHSEIPGMDLDEVDDLSCPYVDDLKKWIDCGCVTKVAFPDNRDRFKWWKTKLPAIKTYMENEYGY